MPKATSPILGTLRGTLKGGPTFRDNPQTDRITMQTKPVPTGAPTAAQLAVRNAYARLAYLWKNLSQLDKEPYQIAAEARNLTPWNAFLSFHLPIMRLEPKFYTVFAEGAGPTITDFAIGGKVSTLNGPVWQEKNNRPCLYQDGIDDRIMFSPPGYYDTDQSLTFLCLLTPNINPILTARLAGTNESSASKTGWLFYRNASGPLSFRKGTGTASYTVTTSGNVPGTTYSAFGFIYSGTSVNFYYNGTWETKTIGAGNLAPSSVNFGLGGNTPGGYGYRGQYHLGVLFPSAWSTTAFEALVSQYQPYFT